jgi:hypothetical protein
MPVTQPIQIPMTNRVMEDPHPADTVEDMEGVTDQVLLLVTEVLRILLQRIVALPFQHLHRMLILRYVHEVSM